MLYIVCTATVGGVAVPPCPEVDGVGYAPTVVEGELVTASDLAAIQSWGAVDWAESGAYFGAAIGIVLSIWLAAWMVGVVVESVRKL